MISKTLRIPAMAEEGVSNLLRTRPGARELSAALEPWLSRREVSQVVSSDVVYESWFS